METQAALQNVVQGNVNNDINMVTKQATTVTYQGLFTSYGAADAYGVPEEIIESLIQPSGLLDRFAWEFNNQPVLPVSMFTYKQGADDGSFAEGGCPTGTTRTESKFVFSAKSFGSCSDHLTLPALASKQHTLRNRRIRRAQGVTTVVSEWESQMFNILQRLANINEVLTLNGDASVNPNNYDGLFRLIRENHTDINGVVQTEADSVVWDEHCTPTTIRKLEEIIGALEDNYVNPADIVLVMRPGLFRHLAFMIALEYQNIGATHQELMRGRTLPLAGFDIPVETTMWIGRTGTPQAYCSHILFLTFNYLGAPSLYHQFFDFSEVVANHPDFHPSPGGTSLTPSPYVLLTRDRSGSEGLCMSSEFCMAAHGRLVAEATQSLGKMLNVEYSALIERTQVNP